MANSNDSNKNYNLSQFRRNHYFYGKLMAVKDFEIEQDYMNEKRHLLSRLVHGTGIVCGLDDAEIYTDEGKVKIKFKSGGFAIDSGGREIVVPADSDKPVYIKEGQTTVNLTRTELESSLYYVYLEYNPVFGEPVNSAATPSSCEETCCPNRVIEDFEVVASTSPPEAAAVLCPVLSGNISEDTARKRIKDWFKSETSKCCTPADESRVFLLALEAVSGGVSVNTEETAPYLSFVYNSKLFAELLTCHVPDFGNPHKTTAAQVGALKSVDGVSHAGGDVDLVESNSITITPDDSANTITIGETHSSGTDNPHGTTAAQVGALSGVDGVSNPGGNVDLVARDSIVITPDDAAKTIAIGETHSAELGNPHQAKHSDLKNILAVDPDKEDVTRNKHVANADANRWNRSVFLINGIVPGEKGLFTIEAGGNITITPGENRIIIASAGGSAEPGVGFEKDLTFIEKIGWKHGETVIANDFVSRLISPEFNITFSAPITAGVDENTFLVMLRVMESTAAARLYRYVYVKGRFAKSEDNRTFAFGLPHEAEAENLLSYIHGVFNFQKEFNLEPRIQVLVQVKCDFILDEAGRPVAGHHVGGTGRSGLHIEDAFNTRGGLFESWFSVVPAM